jgi:hypothetical protein
MEIEIFFTIITFRIIKMLRDIRFSQWDMMLHIEVCTDTSGEFSPISFLNMKDNYNINKIYFDGNCPNKI